MKICAMFLSLLLTLVGCPVWAEGEYAPVPDSRREIDARIEALDAKRAEISMTGPKVTTFLGLGTMVVGGIMLGVGMASCNQQREETGDDECGGKGSGIGVAGAGGGLLVVGASTALTGGIIWGVRANRRNKIDAERESLIEERDGLAATLSRLELRSPYRNRTQFVTLGVRF